MSRSVTGSSQDPPETIEIPTAGRVLPSLSTNSAARFVTDALSTAAALAASVVSARALGPTGKGFYAAYTFLALLIIYMFSLGLGDAAIYLTGQRRATLRTALSSTLFLTALSSAVGAAVFWTASVFAFSADWHVMRTPVLIETAVIPTYLFAYQMSFILSAEERIPASSLVLGTMNWMTALGLCVFLVLVPLRLPGAAVAGMLGAVSGLAVAFALVRRSRARLSFRPSWDRGYVGSAVRYGPPVAASYLVSAMFQRADLLLVYAIIGARSAGHYSIGLTVASLIGMLPLAIANATFPRIAGLPDAEAAALIVRSCRIGLAAAVGAGAALLVVTPIVVPLLFGRGFAPAVAPTLVLIPNGVLWSGQWLLARAWAARGRPGLLVRSFGTSVALMIAVDLVLIRVMGTNGAALGSVVAAAAGLAVCLTTYANSTSWPFPLRAFLPTPRDFRDLVATGNDLVRQVASKAIR